MITISEEAGQRAISLVLRTGSQLSAIVMAIGIGLLLIRGETPSVFMQRSLHLDEIFQGLSHLDPIAVTGLGIFLLLLTPVFRVVVAVATFALERDRKYVLISLGVLAVILFSIRFAVG